jgi:hypothetical protein
MPLHIDEDIAIRSGKDAEAIFAAQNDKQFLSENGIIKVTKERWELAQVCESKHWMRNGVDLDDDRNDEHCINFDFYQSIRDFNFEKAIEFGCGPFTNIRIIDDIANIKRCILLDPLIDKYLDHKNCRYKDGSVF